ncbi:hypothetical protein [Acetomicrobium hydrogeniformans]|uniref:Uncharacterized protein n=1 Tax=Acetomicrobium hydrogeniformans ATCC BAA-1850 TaxID=592015 RepID=A0A0T5XCG8_9BACT|nr:hypothetical protein [Acetomicrobium hydrogeniformans]KRT36060.1 hypothetical protein HMPREF1705_03327 [Acetomicrobium hydrogeniformans ATCC BAA-1850]
MNINEYGKIVRKYHGNGKLRLTNGNELPCSACIQQIETGLILIKCRFDINIEQALFDTPYQEDVEYIYGITSDGLNFKTRGKLVVLSPSDNFNSTSSMVLTTMMFVAQEIELCNENQHTVGQHYKFSVVNFEFKGNRLPKIVIQDGKQVKRYPLELNTPWGIAILNPIPDYDNVILKVRAQKSISVTCELIAKPSEALELNEVINKINELCRLLSLARGTKVNWISAEEYTEDEQACRIIVKNAVTWPFSHLALIDPNNPQDTNLFVEKVYPIYLKLRDSYNLNTAIELYLDAKRETAYLETRALRAVSLLDFLIGRYASQRNLDKIRSDFKKKEKRLRSYLKEDIQRLFQGIKKNELDEMLAKISELNRRSFLNLLKRLRCDLKLNIPEGELPKVKDTRNALVHKAEFQSTNNTDKTREYFRVIRLIDQLFLKLLGYDGYFIDINLDTLEFERRLFSCDGCID